MVPLILSERSHKHVKTKKKKIVFVAFEEANLETDV